MTDYIVQTKLITLMTESYSPQDIVEGLVHSYSKHDYSDPRIIRLIKSLNVALLEWKEPVGSAVIRRINLTEQEKQLIIQTRIIEAIKLVRNRTGVNLKEAKTAVDNYRFGT